MGLMMVFLQNELNVETEESKQLADKRVFLPLLSVKLSDNHSAQRNKVEAYISNQFYKNHQAVVNSFLRLADSEQALFLEQYMDAGADTVIGQLLNSHVARNKVAEIGNLTSSYPGSSQMLFVLIVSILHKLDIEWALFTATDQVQSMIAALNIDCIEICEAQAAQLADSADCWGSYYSNKPKVITGNIAKAYQALCKHPVAGFMLQHYQLTIDQIVNDVRSVK
jgi:hypothetical protein